MITFEDLKPGTIIELPIAMDSRYNGLLVQIYYKDNVIAWGMQLNHYEENKNISFDDEWCLEYGEYWFIKEWKPLSLELELLAQEVIKPRPPKPEPPPNRLIKEGHPPTKSKNQSHTEWFASLSPERQEKIRQRVEGLKNEYGELDPDTMRIRYELGQISIEQEKIIDDEKERQIWDAAVKKCIQITVVDACGSPGPQYRDMEELLFEPYDWEKDEEFLKELNKK